MKRFACIALAGLLMGSLAVGCNKAPKRTTYTIETQETEETIDSKPVIGDPKEGESSGGGAARKGDVEVESTTRSRVIERKTVP